MVWQVLWLVDTFLDLMVDTILSKSFDIKYIFDIKFTDCLNWINGIIIIIDQNLPFPGMYFSVAIKNHLPLGALAL